MTRRVGEGSARRVAGMDAGQFVASTGCAVDKPRCPPANLEGAARKARHPGGLSFGYFLTRSESPWDLGKQESDPASGRRSEARRRRARLRWRVNRAQTHWMTSPPTV